MAASAGPDIVEDGLVLYLDAGNEDTRGVDRNINKFPDGDMSTGGTYGSYSPTTRTIVQASDVPRTNGISRNVIQLNSTANRNGGGNHGGFSVTMNHLTANKKYTVSFYARLVSGSANISLKLNYQSGGGQSSQLDKGFELTSTEWVKFEYSATPSTAWNTLYFWNQSTPNGIWQMADIFIRESKYDSEYEFVDDYDSNNNAKVFDVINSSDNFNLVNGSKFIYENGIDSLSFDGVNDYCNIGSIISLGNQFTIMAMIRLSGTNSDTSIFGSSANGHDNWFGLNSNRVFLYGTQFPDVNNFGVAGTTTLDTTDSVWYHVGATVNIDTVKLYVNGIQEATNTRPYTIGGWTSTGAIGRRGAINQRYFKGSIAKLMTYNTVLTPQEIQQNYNATKSRFYDI